MTQSEMHGMPVLRWIDCQLEQHYIVEIDISGTRTLGIQRVHHAADHFQPVLER